MLGLNEPIIHLRNAPLHICKYQTLDLRKYFNNEIMLTHENSFYINEGKNTTQVAYQITWQQRENWKYVLPVQITATYFTRSDRTFICSLSFDLCLFRF